MARARRARKKSTRRKSTRRTGARRKSTRRTSTRRPKRITRRKRSKGLTRKTQKKILIVAAAVVALVLLSYWLSNTSYVQKRWYSGEVGRNAVYGKVTSIDIGAFRRGTIHVQSFNTGKVYTFYVGRDTNYSPHRYPAPGENAKVYYIYDRGYLKSTLVKIQ
jgi:hypothetical protein